MSDWPLAVAARSSRTRGRQTLARLLDAAEAELCAHGYHGARMAHIAKAAGVAHGTLYVYFRDRDDLLAALQVDVDAELRAALLSMPAVTAGDAGFDDLRTWAESVCAVFQRHGCVLQALAEALNEDDQSAAGRAALQSMQVTTRHMAGRLRDACGTSADYDPEIAGLCLFALIEGGNRAVFRGELDTPVARLAAEIARFVQRAASPP
ncbi:MAG: TetR/AcrR family transcriptional regulator [Acidimicrobiales bacterium]|jgi:AcrR family transcriptional regulator